MTDLSTALAAEIRATEMQRHLLRNTRFGVRYPLTAKIYAARDALASGDTDAMETALEDLKGYGE